VFNATFSNISAISWRPVLVVEEAGENHQPLPRLMVSLFKKNNMYNVQEYNILYNNDVPAL
jgi:hypothetical protein